MINRPTYYDVMWLLEDGGIGTIGTDLFGGEWGRWTDEQILCLEGVGTPADPKELYEMPGVQILVRGEKRGRDIDVYEKAKEVSDYLLGLPDTTDANDVCYKGFEESSNIAPLGKDFNQRFIYSMNFYTYRNRS